MRISLHLSLCCTSTSAITSNNPIVVSYTFEMPNATTTRMLCDCQSFSRELQIFHDKTCQFFLARCMISNLFTGTVSFKLKTAFLVIVYSKLQCHLSVMLSTTLVTCTYHFFVTYIILKLCFCSVFACKLYFPYFTIA